MKIITGGAGFIGSAISWRLNQLGIKDILLVDADVAGTKKNNLENLLYSDLIDKDNFIKKISLDDISFKVETIYHMGACSSTTEQDMEYLKANNFEYSKHLAKWSIRNSVRFIYASSGATYGDGSMGFEDDEKLIPKLTQLNKYGLSKQMFDIWLLENKMLDKVVGLKYFNVFGPNENHKGDMRSMVNKSYSQIEKTGKMQLFKSYRNEYKDGEQKRDFIYVKDAVEMTIFFDGINQIGYNKNGIYNIGAGRASSWNEMAYALFKALGKEPVIEYVEMPDNIKNQYQYYTEANITKLRRAGYEKPVMSLEESVIDYVVNYLMKDKYLSIND
jgi:ADP-L-glycero-D-manno-heptose 6-epimerase